MTESANSSPGSGHFLVYRYSIFASLLCLLMGYFLGIISGAMLIMVEKFNIDIVWHQLITTAAIVGGSMALIPAGHLAHGFGRKKMLLGGNVVVCVGAIVTAVAPGKEVILLGRFVTGIGIAIPSLVVPMYVSECAPVNIRGRLGTLTPLMINVGFVLSAIVGGAFSSVQSGWRYMFALPCVVGVVQFLAFLFAPESPRWLVQVGRGEEALAVLNKLRNDPDGVLIELQDIQRVVASERKLEEEGNKSIDLMRAFRTGPVRRALILALLIGIISQITGVAPVLFYAGTILKMGGFASGSAAWLTTIPTGVQLVATFGSTLFVDRFGRKILYVGGLVGMLISLVILGLGFFLSSTHSPKINTDIVEVYDNGTAIGECHFRTCQECISSDNVQCGFCYDVISRGTCVPLYNNGSAAGGRCLNTDLFNMSETDLFNMSETDSFNMSDFKLHTDFCPTQYSWIPVLASSLYLFSFGTGISVMWIVIPEVFPLWARSSCCSFVTAVMWVTQTIVTISFLSLSNALTLQGAFWLYGGMALVSIIYICVSMPETRGISLEDMEDKFMTRQERERKTAVQEYAKNSIVSTISDSTKL